MATEGITGLNATQLELPLGQRASELCGSAFSENREEPIHRWVNWIAGFSAAFVRDCINRYMPPERGLITDPFAGVGTTLIEAVMAGYDTIGFEINPFAALAGRTKLAALHLSPGVVEELSQQFSEWMAKAIEEDREPQSTEPEGFQSRIPFFSPPILQQVLLLMDFIDELDDGLPKDLMRLVFGATMISFSNYTYEPSLGTRPGAGKPLIEEADVTRIIINKLSEIARDLRRIDHVSHAKWGRSTLHMESFFNCLAKNILGPSSVDLIVTSPPYLNNYHYVRNTRPHLYWLGLAASRREQRKLERENYGRFWQTVRNDRPIALDFDLPEVSCLVEEIRNKRAHKGQYGGPGWANYAACYLNDSWRFIQLVNDVLKPGGTAVVVVGNHIIQGVNVEVDRILSLLGKMQGLECDISLLRNKRVGDSITNSSVRRGRTKVNLYEAAVEMKKV